jgi:hypothetical protein
MKSNVENFDDVVEILKFDRLHIFSLVSKSHDLFFIADKLIFISLLSKTDLLYFK